MKKFHYEVTKVKAHEDIARNEVCSETGTIDAENFSAAHATVMTRIGDKPGDIAALTIIELR